MLAKLQGKLLANGTVAALHWDCGSAQESCLLVVLCSVLVVCQRETTESMVRGKPPAGEAGAALHGSVMLAKLLGKPPAGEAGAALHGSLGLPSCASCRQTRPLPLGHRRRSQHEGHKVRFGAGQPTMLSHIMQHTL